MEISVAAIGIFLLSCVAASFSMMNHWFLSKGKLNYSYPLIICACSCYIVIETYLAIRDPVQLGVLVFNFVNLWAIVMAVKGLLRLKEKQKEEKNATLK
jgi:uncharacterized membrane protein